MGFLAHASPHTIFFLVVSLLLSPASFGADSAFETSFQRLKKSGNSSEIQKFLESSRQKEQNNPDYYALASNYWWGLSQAVNISTKKPQGADFAVVDKDGKAVGSISTQGAIDPQLSERALALVQEGARRFPLRMDLVMGLAYTEKELGKDKECFAVVDSFLKSAMENKQAFKWTHNAPLSQPPAQFIPASAYDYAAHFYESNKPEDEDLCRRLCEDLVNAFPDHPYAYNLLAALSARHQDDAAVIRYLKIARDKAPSDSLILMNLGEAYTRLKNQKDAVECYLAVAKSDASPAVKEQAKKAARSLKSTPAAEKPLPSH